MTAHPQPLRIVLVDDHPVVRDGLHGLIATQDDLTLVAEAAGGEEALAAVRAHRPDLVITDLRMPGVDGVALITALREQDPHLPILVLTMFGTEDDVRPALRAGATGYLLKDASRRELFAGIRATGRGESVLAPAVAGLLVRGHRSSGRETPGPVSPRELAILQLVADGRSNAQIGRALHISEATVKTHLVRLYGKLGATDRASAVSLAYRQGLLSTEDG